MVVLETVGGVVMEQVIVVVVVEKAVTVVTEGAEDMAGVGDLAVAVEEVVTAVLAVLLGLVILLPRYNMDAPQVLLPVVLPTAGMADAAEVLAVLEVLEVRAVRVAVALAAT
jgi:hypothetical protein